jgi:uncharacterized SAM-dependent methyltransferase
MNRRTADVDGPPFEFAEGPSIQTENSHEFSPAGFRDLAQAVGWRPVEIWTDRETIFSVHVLKALNLSSSANAAGCWALSRAQSRG